jgi:ketosteroid isomerase-like protein
MHRSSIANLTIAGLVMLSVTGCHHKRGGEHRADVAKTTEEAKAIIMGVATAYNAHDATKAASYDAPDYISMFHGFQTAIGPAADMASMQQQFQDPAAKFDLNISSVDVARSGEMAVVRSTYVFSSTDPKTKAIVRETGNWVAGLKRQDDGSLKLAWSIGANLPAAAPMPTVAATPAAAATP